MYIYSIPSALKFMPKSSSHSFLPEVIYEVSTVFSLVSLQFPFCPVANTRPFCPGGVASCLCCTRAALLMRRGL